MKNIIEVIYKDYRRQHLYIGKLAGKEYGPFPSVSSIKGVVDKSGPLIIWARREALKLAKTELIAYLSENQAIDEGALDEILKRADREPDRIKDEAGDIGTRVHNAIDLHIVGQEPALDEVTRQGYTNFLAWLKNAGITLLKGDTPLVSLKYGFGGRADAYGKDRDGNFVLLDWKTSNGIYDDFAYQTGGYSLATRETLDEEPKRAFVVRFGKNKPDVEARELNLQESEQCFLACLALYKCIKGKTKLEVWK